MVISQNVAYFLMSPSSSLLITAVTAYRCPLFLLSLALRTWKWHYSIFCDIHVSSCPPVYTNKIFSISLRLSPHMQWTCPNHAAPPQPTCQCPFYKTNNLHIQIKIHNIIPLLQLCFKTKYIYNNQIIISWTQFCFHHTAISILQIWYKFYPESSSSGKKFAKYKNKVYGHLFMWMKSSLENFSVVIISYGDSCV